MNIGVLLLIGLVLLLVGALPAWPYSSDWGYYPTGVLGVLVALFAVLMVLGRI